MVRIVAHWSILSLLLVFVFPLHAQFATVKGKIVDPLNAPIKDALIRVMETTLQTRSDATGNFELEVPAGRSYRFEFSHSGYQTTIIELELVAGRVYFQPVKMLDRQIDQVDIIGEQDATSINDESAMLVNPIAMEDVLKMPVAAPSVEAFIKFQPGAATNNEFSSQYQVRGGNFDENLVYVNGIEIYRPFLTRAGRQEGLGFAHPAMSQGFRFSTGGFGAQYGDKLSSVLDIQYRNPRDFQSTVELGIMTTTLHTEGLLESNKPDKSSRFSYLLGARRFNPVFLLNTLETRGTYRPNYYDIQGMFTYTPRFELRPNKYKTRRDGTVDTIYVPNETLKLTAFMAINRNDYKSIPNTRSTTKGNITQAIRIDVAFLGEEQTNYATGQGALMLTHQPTTRLRMDYILSAFRTRESEIIDLISGYRIGQVNTNFGSEDFNATDFDLGVGAYYHYGRNFLNATVASAQIKGRHTFGRKLNQRLLFSAKAQYQDINANLKEYTVLDSAGFTQDFFGNFNVEDAVRANNTVTSSLYKAYVQHEWQINSRFRLHTGLRGLHYDLTNEWLISPRAELLFKAASYSDGETKLRFRLAGGIYYQPPFYRELQRFDGTLNTNVQSQQAIHAILGTEYRFIAWGRPFLLFSEAYYKTLNQIIPYEVQNIRIRYYPDELATGFAYGLDLRINGQFIRGVDSWLSIGLLNTEEDVEGDEQGFVPRPTDQTLTFSMYFQDELPINPTYKVHVGFIYGSGARYGFPRSLPFRTSFEYPDYQRVDIGFSKIFTLNQTNKKGLRRSLESIWTTIEIFNLLERENTISYIWLKDLSNNPINVPNRLSSRMLNVRVIFNFN